MKSLKYIATIYLCSALIACSENSIETLSSLPPSGIPAEKVITSIYWSDGDSGRITFNNQLTMPFRINDKDAPETGGVGAAIGGAKCEKERELGFNSKEWVVDYTRDADLQITADHGADRYDRQIIDLSVNGKDLGNYGVLQGHYRSWRHDGKKALEPRPDWCGPR